MKSDEIFFVVLMVVGVLSLLLLGPIFTLLAVNVFLKVFAVTPIPITFTTWMACFWLQFIMNARVLRSDKKS